MTVRVHFQLKKKKKSVSHHSNVVNHVGELLFMERIFADGV